MLSREYLVTTQLRACRGVTKWAAVGAVRRAVSAGMGKQRAAAGCWQETHRGISREERRGDLRIRGRRLADRMILRSRSRMSTDTWAKSEGERVRRRPGGSTRG